MENNIIYGLYNEDSQITDIYYLGVPIKEIFYRGSIIYSQGETTLLNEDIINCCIQYQEETEIENRPSKFDNLEERLIDDETITLYQKNNLKNVINKISLKERSFLKKIELKDNNDNLLFSLENNEDDRTISINFLELSSNNIQTNTEYSLYIYYMKNNIDNRKTFKCEIEENYKPGGDINATNSG